MNATLAGTEVERYLSTVRSQLDDLPDDDRDELLDDLAEHLREVAAEGVGSLESRLGPPEDYAEELRASAGLPSRDQFASRRVAQRIAERISHSPVGRAAATIAGSSVGQSLKGFLPELQPGWWVLRGYIAVVAAAMIANDGRSADYSSIPIPYIAGSYALGLAAAIAAVWVSVRFGRRSKIRHRVLWPSIVNGAVVVAFLAGLGAYTPQYVYADGGEPYSIPYLHHYNGAPIANICPYAPDGKLLTGVLLFDQDGRAITNMAPATADGRPVARVQPSILNAFPLTLTVPSFVNGAPEALQCPPSVAPIVAPGVPSAVPSAASSAPGGPAATPGG